MPPYLCSPIEEDASSTGIAEATIAAVIGTYPNPFWEDFVVKTYLFEAQAISIQVFDAKEALVIDEPETKLSQGLHYIQVNGSGLPEGTYYLNMLIGDKLYSRRVVRM